MMKSRLIVSFQNLKVTSWNTQNSFLINFVHLRCVELASFCFLFLIKCGCNTWPGKMNTFFNAEKLPLYPFTQGSDETVHDFHESCRCKRSFNFCECNCKWKDKSWERSQYWQEEDRYVFHYFFLKLSTVSLDIVNLGFFFFFCFQVMDFETLVKWNEGVGSEQGKSWVFCCTGTFC